MTELVKNIVVIIALIGMVFVSGCTDTVETSDPVSADNVFLDIAPVTIKEFHEQDISVVVTNNATKAIESVTVSDLVPLTLTGTASVNIAGKEDTAESTILNAKVSAPAFDTDVNGSSMTISYLSGADEEGAPIERTKTIPVNVTLLPDVKLQFLGFVEDMDSLRTTSSESWELEAGENATISFSVKNHGQSTVPAETLRVVADVDNKLIADQASMNISQAMARSGTSYTKGMQIPVKEDAPNGETDVYVRLLYDGHIIDEQKLVLKVKL